MHRWLFIGALLVPRLATAHAADMIYASLSGKGGGAFDELVTMTAATVGLLAPVDANGDRELTQAELDAGAAAIEAGIWDAMPLTAGGAPCARSSARAYLREGYVELDAHFQCPRGELAQKFKVLSLLPGGYRVVLASDVAHARSEGLAQGDEQTLVIREGFAPASSSAAFAAFLVAVLLVASNGRQLLFWLGCAIAGCAVGLAARGFIPLEPRWAVLAGAVAVVYLAAENLITSEHKLRPGFAAGLGLVQGVGLSAQPSLAAWGVGALVLSAATWRFSGRLRPWVVRLGSAALVGAGAFWMVRQLWV